MYASSGSSTPVRSSRRAPRRPWRGDGGARAGPRCSAPAAPSLQASSARPATAPRRFPRAGSSWRTRIETRTATATPRPRAALCARTATAWARAPRRRCAPTAPRRRTSAPRPATARPTTPAPGRYWRTWTRTATAPRSRSRARCARARLARSVPFRTAASGKDCDDADRALTRFVVLYPDQDDDGVGVPARAILCLGATIPTGQSLHGYDPDVTKIFRGSRSGAADLRLTAAPTLTSGSRPKTARTRTPVLAS